MSVVDNLLGTEETVVRFYLGAPEIIRRMTFLLSGRLPDSPLMGFDTHRGVQQLARARVDF